METVESEYEAVNTNHNGRKRFAGKKSVIFISLLISFCAAMGLGGVILYGRRRWLEQKRNALNDFIEVENYQILPLPNDYKALVYNTAVTMIVGDEDSSAKDVNFHEQQKAHIQLNSIVYSRILRYLERQLSLNEDRCSPWVVDTFYPNDNLAVTHCLHNGTFSFQIKDQVSNNFVAFNTDMKPFSVDLFLKRFSDAENVIIEMVEHSRL